MANFLDDMFVNKVTPFPEPDTSLPKQSIQVPYIKPEEIVPHPVISPDTEARHPVKPEDELSNILTKTIKRIQDDRIAEPKLKEKTVSSLKEALEALKEPEAYLAKKAESSPSVPQEKIDLKVESNPLEPTEHLETRVENNPTIPSEKIDYKVENNPLTPSEKLATKVENTPLEPSQTVIERLQDVESVPVDKVTHKVENSPQDPDLTVSRGIENDPPTPSEKIDYKVENNPKVPQEKVEALLLSATSIGQSLEDLSKFIEKYGDENDSFVQQFKTDKKEFKALLDSVDEFVKHKVENENQEYDPDALVVHKFDASVTEPEEKIVSKLGREGISPSETVDKKVENSPSTPSDKEVQKNHNISPVENEGYLVEGNSYQEYQTQEGTTKEIINKDFDTEVENLALSGRTLDKLDDGNKSFGERLLSAAVTPIVNSREVAEVRSLVTKIGSFINDPITPLQNEAVNIVSTVVKQAVNDLSNYAESAVLGALGGMGVDTTSAPFDFLMFLPATRMNIHYLMWLLDDYIPDLSLKSLLSLGKSASSILGGGQSINEFSRVLIDEYETFLKARSDEYPEGMIDNNFVNQVFPSMYLLASDTNYQLAYSTLDETTGLPSGLTEITNADDIRSICFIADNGSGNSIKNESGRYWSDRGDGWSSLSSSGGEIPTKGYKNFISMGINDDSLGQIDDYMFDVDSQFGWDITIDTENLNTYAPPNPFVTGWFPIKSYDIDYATFKKNEIDSQLGIKLSMISGLENFCSTITTEYIDTSLKTVQRWLELYASSITKNGLVRPYKECCCRLCLNLYDPKPAFTGANSEIIVTNRKIFYVIPNFELKNAGMELPSSGFTGSIVWNVYGEETIGSGFYLINKNQTIFDGDYQSGSAS